MSDTTTMWLMFLNDHANPLSELECHGLLARAHVGHVSLTMRALPIVVPVNYAYLNGNVIIGMDDGPERRAVADGCVIAMGVDSNDLTDDAFWSVLVIGQTTKITDPAERTEVQGLGLATPTGNAQAHYLKLRPGILTGYRAET